MAKILIVEDDSLLSRMYQKIFESEKYDVVMAKDGQEGLDQARREKPVLILLDIMMPRMNGLQVLEKLKGDKETKEIPVVILTNLAGEHDAERALSLGAVKYIIKSQYRPKEVEEMVRGIIAGYTRNEIPETGTGQNQ